RPALLSFPTRRSSDLVASLGCLAWLAIRRRGTAESGSAGDLPHTGATPSPHALGGAAPLVFAAAALTLWGIGFMFPTIRPTFHRSEEHTSELQSLTNL